MVSGVVMDYGIVDELSYVSLGCSPRVPARSGQTLSRDRISWTDLAGKTRFTMTSYLNSTLAKLFKVQTLWVTSKLR
jgi:hypothetical protein